MLLKNIGMHLILPEGGVIWEFIRLQAKSKQKNSKMKTENWLLSQSAMTSQSYVTSMKFVLYNCGYFINQ